MNRAGSRYVAVTRGERQAPSVRGDAVTSVARRPVPTPGVPAEAYRNPSQMPVTPRPGPSHRAQVTPPSVRAIKNPGRADARAVLAVIAAGALAVIALWWHSTPSVTGLGGWLRGAGQVLGLLSGYGVVVLVALMARIPPLERGLGADRLAMPARRRTRDPAGIRRPGRRRLVPTTGRRPGRCPRGQETARPESARAACWRSSSQARS